MWKTSRMTIFSAELSDGNRFIGQQGTDRTTVPAPKKPSTVSGISAGYAPKNPPNRAATIRLPSAKYGWNEDLHGTVEREAAGPDLCGRPGVAPSQE
jgi:hypothetical protein